MFDLVNGLPVHPLVVHAVVVLLPLAVVGAVALAVRPAWLRPYGPLIAGAAVLATVLMPVATSSGEALQERVGDPGRHAELGDQLLWFSLPLTALLVALVYLDRRTDAAQRTVRVVTGLALVAALVAGVQTYRVGDSGARAAWGDRVGSASR